MDANVPNSREKKGEVRKSKTIVTVRVTKLDYNT